MIGKSLYFAGPERMTVEDRQIPDPGPEEVLVRTTRSAISQGTELLIYRNEVPSHMATDETIESLDGTLSYPLQYGYAAVGEVAGVGTAVADDWYGRQVFAFNPHESHFLADPSDLIPTDLPAERAVLLANAEAAVNFVMDARPRIGERVVVFGQGPVGLLTTALLASFPLEQLVTVDYFEKRRRLSERLGADLALHPEQSLAGVIDGDGADLTIEVSGDPSALDDALAVTGFAGSVIVGSWYGTRDVTLDLGGEYHRSHVRMQSSQVSRLDPAHTDRWTKSRRMDVAETRLSTIDVEALVSHRIPIDRAAEAYRLLSEEKGETVQVLLTYD